MTERKIYVCDYCGNESEDASEIEFCEAWHTSMTDEEIAEWDALETEVRVTAKEYMHDIKNKAVENKLAALAKKRKEVRNAHIAAARRKSAQKAS